MMDELPSDDERAIRQTNDVYSASVVRAERAMEQARTEERAASRRCADARRLLKAFVYDWARALRGRGPGAAEQVAWQSIWCWEGKWEGRPGSSISEVCKELPLLVGILGEPLTITFNGFDLVCDDEFVSPTQLYDLWQASMGEIER